MKVKALSRPSATTTRQNSKDVRIRHRNLDPTFHPMSRPREYARAVTSAKLERMFAKPFVGSLDGGHADAVTAASTSCSALAPFVTGGADGEVRIWDLTSRTCIGALGGGHGRAVTGLTFDDVGGGSGSGSGSGGAGRRFYSCSDDGLVRLWSAYPSLSSDSYSSTLSDGAAAGRDSDDEDGKPRAARYGEARRSSHPSAIAAAAGRRDGKAPSAHGPYGTWRIDGTFKSVHHHRTLSLFATSSDSSVSIWNPERSHPVQNYRDPWGSDDTISVVRYNPAEPDLLGAVSVDRGIGLFDSRLGSPLGKVVLAMRCNCIEWNPMEPMNFVVGNEDYNSYGFDMRKLDRPMMIYKGHTGAVLDVSWSPTGREFVSGSYDKTIRFFRTKEGTSRDVYHLKRMQRVWTVNYTADDRYVLSGSDDTNVRLWKSNASERIGQTTGREDRSLLYRQALVKKYRYMPEVRRIHRSRRIPKLIRKEAETAQLKKESEARKLENRIKHSREGTVTRVAERDKTVIKKID